MLKKKSFFLIILACLFWGTSGIFVHYLTPYGASAMQMAAIRGMVSFCIFAVYVLIFNRRFFCLKLRDLPLFIGSGISMFLAAGFYYLSMQMTSVSTSVILMYTAPVFVMCYSVIFLKEKLTKIKVLSVVFMVIGCALVSGVVSGMKYNLPGIIIGLLSGVAYSAYNIITKISMKKNVNPITATVYSYLFMALSAFCVASPGGIVHIALNNPPFVSALMIAMGVCTFTIPYFLYNIGLNGLPAGTAASLGVGEPLAATLYSVILFGEKLDGFSICGIVLILSAVVMLAKTETGDEVSG